MGNRWKVPSVVAVGLIVSLLGCPAPEAPKQKVEPSLQAVSGEAFGTTWSAKWRSDSTNSADTLSRIQSVLDEVDVHMSKYRPDSEISRARREGGPVPVSHDTAMVVDAALDLSEVSGGAFDPTVEPLMSLWGFGGKRRDVLPSEAEIQEVVSRVGWRKVKLERNRTGALLDTGGTSLDLGAIAKGHGVDRVHNMLTAQGYSSVFVEVGGEVRVSGPASEGRPKWNVGVSLPDKNAQPDDYALVVSLTNGAVATSGNYRSNYDLGDESLVHTMDPRVGRPVVTQVASATVIAPNCRTADGLATTMMVLPAEQALELAESMPDVEAALMLFAPEGNFKLVYTDGMAGHVQVVSDRVRR